MNQEAAGKKSQHDILGCAQEMLELAPPEARQAMQSMDDVASLTREQLLARLRAMGVDSQERNDGKV